MATLVVTNKKKVKKKIQINKQNKKNTIDNYYK